MSTFSLDFSHSAFQPLAAKMRPQTLKQYCGQEHLIGAGKPLYKAIENGHIHSMIFGARLVQEKQRWQRLLHNKFMLKLSVFLQLPPE